MKNATIIKGDEPRGVKIVAPKDAIRKEMWNLSHIRCKFVRDSCDIRLRSLPLFA